MQRSYENGLDESTVEIFDEALGLFHIDNGCVLDFQGSNRVTCLDVASGKNCFTACIRISGGQRAWIENILVIFQKPNGKYPISGVSNNIDRVTYCSSPKIWMSAQMFVNYFSDSDVIQPLENNRTRTTWIDPCRIHN